MPYGAGMENLDPGSADSVQPDLTEVKNSALNHLNRMRYFRRQYDTRRAYFYRQYIGTRDTRLFPDRVTPRSNTFVPYPLSNVETVVARVMDAFFSFDPWFETKGRGAADEPAAESMHKVLHYMLPKAKFQAAFEELVRNICIYGHSGIKVDWDWGYDMIPQEVPIPAMDPETGQPVLDPMTGQPVIERTETQMIKVPKMRPKFIPIDVFDLLVDPDGAYTAHLTERTFADLKREAEANPEYYYPEALKEIESKLVGTKEADNTLIRIAELWNEEENTQTIMVYGEDSEAISWKDTRLSYRAASYSAYRRRVYAGSPIVLYHGPNPFMHKQSTILHTSYIKLPNEIFGLGVVEVISDLVEGVNRFTNMIADNWNMGINRRYVYDTDADIDHQALNQFNVPGGKIGVSGNPSDKIFPLPSFTPQRGDYQIIDLYKGMIEMTSGISDFYSKGIGAPTGNRTATGINSVIQESNYKFRLFIRNLERDILQPLLGICAAMFQQFMTDDMEVLITDMPPGVPKYPVIQPRQILGAFDFHLVAANYAANKTVRQRNLLAFYNVASQSPFWNQYEGLKEMGKVFEIRAINRLLKTPEQVAQEQAAQLQQQIQMMILEASLDMEAAARKASNSASNSGGKKTGRPRSSQFEGKIPGAGMTSEVRDIAQSMGANVLGTAGSGEG